MLPQRTWQHMAEADAYKLLLAKLPRNWVLRTMTERDYGNDFLVEFTDDEGMMTGQTAWIQLKARKRIKWNRSGKIHIGDVKKSTTNYWRANTAPVFIFLVDLERQEIYFLCTEHYIRSNFMNYLKQGKFSYYFDKLHDRFDSPEGEQLFHLHLKAQDNRRQLESEITIFLTNLQYYQDAVLQSITSEKGARSSRPSRYRLKTLLNNYDFLCDYFHLKKFSTSFAGALRKGSETGTNVNIAREYCLKETQVLFCIRKLLESELAYWTFTNAEMYYHVYSLTTTALGCKISE